MNTGLKSKDQSRKFGLEISLFLVPGSRFRVSGSKSNVQGLGSRLSGVIIIVFVPCADAKNPRGFETIFAGPT